jgi:acid phosphatase (class A)
MSLRTHWARSALVALVLGGPGLAHGQGSAGAAKPPAADKALTLSQIDPAVILPPPPAEGSAQQRAELDELRDIQAARTPDRLAQARWDDAHEDPTAFAGVIGLGFDLKALPKTAALLDLIMKDQEVLATKAKAVFHRARPFVADPDLIGCSRGAKVYTSYPSGHATMAYSIAPVLEALMPAKAQAIAMRADDYAYSRLVCEVHYRSDLWAGQILGTWTATALLGTPALQSSLQAARKELAAAGLTAP